MPKHPEGKAGLYIYVDKRLLEDFRRLVFQKYGRFHGALSHEIEQAMRVWLAQHTQGAHKIKMSNPKPTVCKVFDKVKKYLEDTFGYAAIITGQHIPRQHLVMAIAAVQGSDDRTIRKWINSFIQFKLIKHIGGEVFEVL